MVRAAELDMLLCTNTDAAAAAAAAVHKNVAVNTLL